MRIFSVGELWGPLKPCKCGAESWNIILTDAENESLPENSGHIAVQYIFDNKLGIDCCTKCVPLIVKDCDYV